MEGKNVRNHTAQPLTLYRGVVKKLIWMSVMKKLQRKQSYMRVADRKESDVSVLESYRRLDSHTDILV